MTPAAASTVGRDRVVAFGWEKNLVRFKVLKIGSGTQDLLGPRAHIPWNASLLFSVLASRKCLLC